MATGRTDPALQGAMRLARGGRFRRLVAVLIALATLVSPGAALLAAPSDRDGAWRRHAALDHGADHGAGDASAILGPEHPGAGHHARGPVACCAALPCPMSPGGLPPACPAHASPPAPAPARGPAATPHPDGRDIRPEPPPPRRRA